MGTRRMTNHESGQSFMVPDGAVERYERAGFTVDEGARWQPLPGGQARGTDGEAETGTPVPARRTVGAARTATAKKAAKKTTARRAAATPSQED